jgi:hypothetical protein
MLCVTPNSYAETLPLMEWYKEVRYQGGG